MSRRYKKLVLVEWADAIEHADGGPDAPLHEPAIQYLVGFLLKKNRKGVSVASEMNGDGTGWRGENFIPRGMVLRITRLKKVR